MSSDKPTRGDINAEKKPPHNLHLHYYMAEQMKYQFKEYQNI